MKARIGLRGAPLFWLLGVALAAASAPADAHHAFVMFDINHEVTLEGTVKAFQWTNPHAWVELIVKDGAGKDVEWSIEGSSPTTLARFGWTRTSIKAGDRIQAVIHPLKNGAVGGSLIKITVNGHVVGAPKPS
jgi:hypothetical protein